MSIIDKLDELHDKDKISDVIYSELWDMAVGIDSKISATSEENKSLKSSLTAITEEVDKVKGLL